MEFGVLLGDVPASVGPREHLDIVLRQAEAAQASGFTMLALGQHFLYGDIRWLQPIPALARLAGEVGPQVRLATTVLIAPLHHPVVLAEELATLDIVTGGRLTVGLGMGYRREEYRQFGIPFESRVARFEEMVVLLRELWTADRVTFSGRHWALDEAQPHLRPVQQPTPPIWIGANTDVGVRRAARLGDAWPIGPRMPVDVIEEHLATYAGVRSELGLPVGRQPIRREIVLGRDRDEARQRYAAMTSERYRGYSARERDALPGGYSGADSTAILGDPGQVRADLQRLTGRLELGPVIIRAQWPGMTSEDVIGYLNELGEHVVRPLASSS